MKVKHTLRGCQIIVSFTYSFITLLLFPYLTRKAHILTMFQSIALRSMFNYIMPLQTVLYKKFSYFPKFMHNLSFRSRLNVQYIEQYFKCFALSIKISKL